MRRGRRTPGYRQTSPRQAHQGRSGVTGVQQHDGVRTLAADFALLLTPGAAVRPDDQQSVPGVAAGRPSKSVRTSARWRLSWIYTTKATAISARTSSRISRVLRKTRPPPVLLCLRFGCQRAVPVAAGGYAYEVPPEVTPTTLPASAGWMARGTSRRGTGSWSHCFRCR